MKTQTKKMQGFTLLELITTITVAGIMVALAVPSFTSMIQRNEVVSVANDILSSIHFARSESIKLNKNIGICPSSNAKTCSGGWVDGWVVLDGGTVLLAKSQTHDNISIAGTGKAAAAFTFTPRGRTTVNTTGIFTVVNGDFESQVLLSEVGSARVKRIK